MKKSLLLLLCVSMSYFLVAQESIKQKEIGLAFNNLDNFGFSFKTGTDKYLWRFNTLIISGSNKEYTTDNYVNTQSNMGFGITFGKEYRKDIVENLEFRCGADFSFTYSKTKSDYDDITIINEDKISEQTMYTPGVNLVLGINYVLKDNIIIGAEILPNISYTYGEAIEKSSSTNNGDEVVSDISGISYGLSNTSVLLSLAYRF